jgi:hypothetical protein
MKRAQRRDAVREGRFFFRKNVFQNRGRGSNGFGPHSRASSVNSASTPRANSPEQPGPVEDEYTEMTMDEIFNGTAPLRQEDGDGDDCNGASSGDEQPQFPGLLGLVQSYINSLNVDLETKCALDRYLDLVRRRANGELEIITNLPDGKTELGNVSRPIDDDSDVDETFREGPPRVQTRFGSRAWSHVRPRKDHRGDRKGRSEGRRPPRRWVSAFRITYRDRLATSVCCLDFPFFFRKVV